MDDINNPDNPFFIIRWDSLSEEDGGRYLEQYIVSITISSRVLPRSRRQAEGNSRIEVGPDVTSYTFDGVTKYSRFDVQVLADLGSLGERPVTGVTTITSGPARK